MDSRLRKGANRYTLATSSKGDYEGGKRPGQISERDHDPYRYQTRKSKHVLTVGDGDGLAPIHSHPKDEGGLRGPTKNVALSVDARLVYKLRAYEVLQGY